MHSGKKLMWNKKKQFPFQYVMKLQEYEKIIKKNISFHKSRKQKERRAPKTNL
jgi:hypothetical protein